MERLRGAAELNPASDSDAPAIAHPVRACLALLSPRMAGVLAALLAFCVIGTGGLTFLARDHAKVLAFNRAELRADSLAGAGVVRRAFGTLDLVVSAAINDFTHGRLEWEQLGDRLARQPMDKELLSSLESYVIAGKDGRVVQSSDPRILGRDVSARSYFRVHHTQPDIGMFVSDPLTLGAGETRPIVPLSWAIRDGQGRLQGVLAVAASWQLYVNIFADLVTWPGQIIGLVKPGGEIYATNVAPGPDTLEEAAHFIMVESPGSGSRIRPRQEIIDGTVVARADIPPLGLEIVTSTTLATVLKDWRLRSYIVIGVVLAVSMGAGVLVGLLQRYIQVLRGAAVDALGAQARAEAGDRAKAQFLAAMSHEIRTPMTGVLGMADLLAAEPLEPRQQGYVEVIRTSGRHLLSIINDVLDFSRARSGALVLEQIDFPVSQLFEQTRSIMAPQARERGLSLDFTLDPASPATLRGDPTRLRQILVNLIGNGLKFTSEGGVRVSYRCMAGKTADRLGCRFEVQDSGIGIPLDQQGELFDAFMQADLSISRKYGGSGLGLAICRQLVTVMGGQIGVQSEPGAGSLFWIEVPLEAGTRPIAETAPTVFQPGAMRSLRILVAEDVAINRDLLQAVLGRAGHELVLVENGQEAVERAAAERFDVILMDVQMPVLDGIEASRRIRAMPPPAGTIPIMALTANVMDPERQRCLQAGMAPVLTKPIVWPDLFGALADIPQTNRPAEPQTSRPAETVGPADGLPTPAPEVPLIDRAHIDGLGQMAGLAKLAELLANAQASAEALAAEISARRDQPADTAWLAHRLAGTAPSFGLMRIGAIARHIEIAALKGRVCAEDIEALGLAVAATRAELERSVLNLPL